MTAHRRLRIGRSAVVEEKTDDGIVPLLRGLMERCIAGSRGGTDLQNRQFITHVVGLESIVPVRRTVGGIGPC
jgi:hypothetical protein